MTSIAESIAARLAERDALATELAAVKAQLVKALSERDTAKAEATRYRTYYSRTGW